MSSSSSSESSDTEPAVNDQKTKEMKIDENSDFSDSSSEEEEVPPTPPPAPKKKKKKRIKPELIVPVQIPQALAPSDSPIPKSKEKKKKDKKKKKEPDTPVQECDPSEQPHKKKRKKVETVNVPTSHPDVTVQVKKKKPGPRTQKIIVYEEDLPKPKYQIVHKSRKRGRPPTKAEMMVENKDDGVQIQENQIIIDRPEKRKELSARQLKRMELDQKFVEMEAIAGRKLRQTKNGKVDKRCVKERSPAQIAAAKRLAEYNKELRKKKKQEDNKDAVKEVISELAVAQQMRKKDTQNNEKPKEPQEQSVQSNEFSLFAY